MTTNIIDNIQRALEEDIMFIEGAAHCMHGNVVITYFACMQELDEDDEHFEVYQKEACDLQAQVIISLLCSQSCPLDPLLSSD